MKHIDKPSDCWLITKDSAPRTDDTRKKMKATTDLKKHTQATCYTKGRTETRHSVRRSLFWHICCRCRLLNYMSSKSIKSRTYDMWTSFPTRLIYASAAIITVSKRNVFWDVTSRWVETWKRFGVTYYLHFQTISGMGRRFLRNASKFSSRQDWYISTRLHGITSYKSTFQSVLNLKTYTQRTPTTGCQHRLWIYYYEFWPAASRTRDLWTFIWDTNSDPDTSTRHQRNGVSSYQGSNEASRHCAGQ